MASTEPPSGYRSQHQDKLWPILLGSGQHGREVADLLRVLGNVNAIPADLTSMMMRRLIWFIVLSFSFAFIVTAAAGPVVSVAVCAGVLIYALAVARGDAARRA